MATYQLNGLISPERLREPHLAVLFQRFSEIGKACANTAMAVHAIEMQQPMRATMAGQPLEKAANPVTVATVAPVEEAIAQPNLLPTDPKENARRRVEEIYARGN